MKKILITGSKWKTSLSMFIDGLLQNSLVVNSEFLKIKENNNTKYFKSWKELLSLYKTIPSWCPFKFLILQDFFHFDYYIAETDINNAFCEIPWIWIWTKKIDIAILTNVFKEHIDGKLINSYEELIEKKLSLLFDNLHYQDTFISNVILNINSKEIYELLLKLLTNYKDKNFNLFLCIDNTLNIDLSKTKNIKKIIYYDNKSFDWKNLKDYKLSFDWLYKPSSSILSILYLLVETLKLDINLKEITFPRWLGRMDIVEKNGNKFIIDHISEKESFEWLIKLLKEYYRWKKINLIFSLKYDALDNKINIFWEILKNLLKNWVISKIYLYDNLQVRWKESIKTRTEKYKAFDLINKLQTKVPNAEILTNRDKKIEEILSKTNSDEVYVVSLNSIESEYFKKTFNLY